MTGRARNSWWLVVVGALLVVLPAAAQLEVSNNLKLNLSGDLSSGYGGQISDPGPSDHNLGLGATGALTGFYYNPNFLNFQFLPYYNRSQANSDIQSVSDTSGFNASFGIFSGSHFPGSIGFSKEYDQSGQFGLPGASGIITHGNGQSFSIGWGVLFPGWPTLSANFSTGSGSSSVYGAPGESTSSSRNFTLQSGYQLHGFNLQGAFIHTTSDANVPAFLEGFSQQSIGSLNSFQVSASHTLPLHGGFSTAFSRSSYSYEYVTDQTSASPTASSQGNSDTLNAVVTLQPTSRVVTSFVATYSDNVAGSLAQQIISAGGTSPQVNLGAFRSLLLSGDAFITILSNLSVHTGVSRQEQFIAGEAYGVTQFNASANYGYNRPLLGSLYFSAGLYDSATQEGNTGLGGWAGVNFSRKIDHFDLGASFNYSQSVQTLLAVYTSSGYSYGVSAGRKLSNRTYWNASFAGSKSAFSTGGSDNHAERISNSLSYHGYVVNAFYSQSTGTAILTATGLIAPPPGLPPQVISPLGVMLFDAKSWGVSGGLTALRRLSISGSYAKGTSSTLSPLQNTASDNEVVTGMLRYPIRKMSFNAGVTQLKQRISTLNTVPTVVTSYYFGVSRWFSVF